MSYSPDGKTLAAANWDCTIKLWEARTLKERDILHTKQPAMSIAFSPDSRLLAGGDGENGVNLWSVQSGKILRTLKGHRELVLSVAFSPDGKTLASASGNFFDAVGFGELFLWKLDEALAPRK